MTIIVTFSHGEIEIQVSHEHLIIDIYSLTTVLKDLN